MVSHTLDMILTIVVLSFWFAFPIGIFLSVSHVDKNTDQIIRLNELRHDSEDVAPDVILIKKNTPRRTAKVSGRPTLIPH